MPRCPPLGRYSGESDRVSSFKERIYLICNKKKVNFSLYPADCKSRSYKQKTSGQLKIAKKIQAFSLEGQGSAVTQSKEAKGLTTALHDKPPALVKRKEE